MSEIEGARGAFESWLRRENGKWADKITERHADGRYCTLQAYMDWGAFQAGWLAALTSIDPETISAEARAEALMEAADRYCKNVCAWPSTEWEHPDECECSQRAAILADEPKEREADENNCPMIEAWVWPSGEWKIQAASAQQWKEHGIFQIVPIFSRAEVERKLKEAEV